MRQNTQLDVVLSLQETDHVEQRIRLQMNYAQKLNHNVHQYGIVVIQVFVEEGGINDLTVSYLVVVNQNIEQNAVYLFQGTKHAL